jgi:PleD family two-component response regulator
VIVLPETGLEEARHMAATLTQHVLAQTGHGLSIGVACRQTGTAGFLDLLRDADQDLYARKLARRTERPLRTADPG